jgi:hypothetical protein
MGLSRRTRFIKQCAYCGKEFSTTPCRTEAESTPANVAKYCSQKCQHLSMCKIIEQCCARCNTKFYVRPHRARQKYCSPNCSQLAQRVKKLKKHCALCGGRFYVLPRNVRQKFCSHKCHFTSKDFILHTLNLAHDPLVLAKRGEGIRRAKSKHALAYGYLRELLGAEMLDQLLEPVGKNPSPRMSAAYTLLCRLSSEDLARLALNSVSSNTGVTR